ncbi:hypothetical protein [Faecalispora jeddahensis]|uniref:hypothetical protein n=1 Tax=Faecalispora jeddahensis TaxID=1414721 RepID=UPI00189B910F|nr:hypothetical protein [Faecalispora jeddahensis]
MNSFKGLSILDFDIFRGNSCGAEFGTLPQSEQAMDFLAFSDDMNKNMQIALAAVKQQRRKTE